MTATAGELSGLEKGLVLLSDPHLVALAATWVVGAYLFGSIPWGLWLVKAIKGIDVREVGSGNIGTTNVYRAAGKGMAALVLLLDVGKGCLPCYLAMLNAPLPVAVLAGAAAILGHSKSIFLRFSGGKSVATGIGTFLALAPMVAGATLAVFAGVFAASRRVSSGSIGAAIALPIFAYAFATPVIVQGYALLAAAYVIVRHRENIARLRAGTEAQL